MKSENTLHLVPLIYVKSCRDPSKRTRLCEHFFCFVKIDSAAEQKIFSRKISRHEKLITSYNMWCILAQLVLRVFLAETLGTSLNWYSKRRYRAAVHVVGRYLMTINVYHFRREKSFCSDKAGNTCSTFVLIRQTYLRKGSLHIEPSSWRRWSWFLPQVWKDKNRSLIPLEYEREGWHSRLPYFLY